jgi:hypothetical protein
MGPKWLNHLGRFPRKYWMRYCNDLIVIVCANKLPKKRILWLHVLMCWPRTQIKIFSFELVLRQECEPISGHPHGRILLNECVIMPFNHFRIITIQASQIESYNFHISYWSINFSCLSHCFNALWQPESQKVVSALPMDRLRRFYSGYVLKILIRNRFNPVFRSHMLVVFHAPKHCNRFDSRSGQPCRSKNKSVR